MQKCVFIFFYLDPIFEKKVLKNNFKKCSLMQCTSQFFFPAQREITLINGKWFWPTYCVLEGKKFFLCKKTLINIWHCPFSNESHKQLLYQTRLIFWYDILKYGLEIYSVRYKFNLEVKFINKWFWKIRKNTLERKDICNLWVMSLWVQS